MTESSATLTPRLLAASTQSRHGYYRFGAIGEEQIEVVAHDRLGVRRRHRLPFASAAIETIQDEPSSLEALHGRTQSGRWEVDLQLARPRSDLAIELESSGEIRDVVWLPAADNVVFRKGPGRIGYRHRSSHPQAWARLLVELHPPDAALRIWLSPTDEPVTLQCGRAEPPPEELAPGRCFEAGGDPGDLPWSATAPSRRSESFSRRRVRRPRSTQTWRPSSQPSATWTPCPSPERRRSRRRRLRSVHRRNREPSSFSP
jgi:hypothetical protein